MLVHTVCRGDSLWQIAKEYQISLDALLAANPQIADPNYILPGSKINIPNLLAPQENRPEQKPEADETAEEYEPYDYTYECCCNNSAARPCIYITQGGETLHQISAEFQLPLAQLHYHNYQYTQSMQLPAGERIIIPSDAAVQIKPQPRNRRR